MTEYKPVFGAEPTDKYEKAKQDLLQALKSYGELTPHQKEELLIDFLGAANVAALCNALKNISGEVK